MASYVIADFSSMVVWPVLMTGIFLLPLLFVTILDCNHLGVIAESIPLYCPPDSSQDCLRMTSQEVFLTALDPE